ncbi:MAG: peptide ABC transporter substrate-binding protein [Desulfobacula sp.]|jgi:peptide/nickel transport system substrate-binding protein
MKKNRLRMFICVFSILFIGIIAFPSSGFSAEKAKLQVGWSEGPQAGMNPFLARSEGDYLFLGLMYEPLVLPFMDGTVKPWLAKKWDYNKDEASWIFQLDERAKWSDGKPVTADDVKFTFDTIYKNNLPLGSTTKAFVKSIEVLDSHKVKFNMASGFAAFLPIAGGTLIMPKHVWENVGPVESFANSQPVTSGPFLFQEYKPRMYLRLVKNEAYWQGKPGIDEVLIKIFMNTEAAVVALKKGELDVMPDLSGNESLIPTLLSDANAKVCIDKWPHILYIAPNYRKYPMNDLTFRKAMDLAVDKKPIISVALGGYGEMPLMGYVPPLSKKWADYNLTWVGANLSKEERTAKANKLLDDLGFKMGKDGVRQMKDGKPLTFSLRCITYPSYIRASQMIKEDLAAIGVKIEVTVSDPETLYGGIVYSGKGSDGWEMIVHGSTMDPDPDHFAREFAPDNPTPWDNATAFGWKNDEIQSILKASRREMDEKKRHELITKAQALFAENLAVVTLGHRLHPAVYRTDKFKGWDVSPVCYGGMVHPLGSIHNIYSLSVK